MAFTGCPGRGPAIGGGVPACNADSAGFATAQLDFLNVIIKNPFYEKIGRLRMAPAIAGAGTGKAVGFGGTLEGLVMVHTA